MKRWNATVFGVPLLALALMPAPPGTRASAEEREHRQESAGVEAGGRHDDHEAHDERVVLTEEEMREFGIELAEAGPGLIETRISLPGEVRPNADRLAHIVPRYPGIVTAVRAELGDRVDVGEVLAVVESDESLAPFEVRTLISGTVIGKHITLGEAVSRDGDAFLIADLDTVWIELTVYQRDLHRVRPGQDVRMLVGHEPVEQEARVDYVTPVLDPGTRTATARLVLDNRNGTWLPGMFVTGQVLVENRRAPVTVPRTAIHDLDGDPVVFVQEAEGFHPRRVTLGARGDRDVEVVTGLGAGERYAATGGFFLKADLAKESFGSGHAH